MLAFYHRAHLIVFCVFFAHKNPAIGQLFFLFDVKGMLIVSLGANVSDLCLCYVGIVVRAHVNSVRCYPIKGIVTGAVYPRIFEMNFSLNAARHTSVHRNNQKFYFKSI